MPDLTAYRQHCEAVPADFIQVEAAGRTVGIGFNGRILQTVFMAPEDALRFARAILNAADVASEAEQA